MSITVPRVLASSNIIQNVPASSNVEVCQVSGIGTRSAQASVVVQGTVTITPGTAATTVTMTMLRIAGATYTALSTTGSVPVTAGGTVTLSLTAVDTPGEVENIAYELAVDVASSSTASTVVAAGMMALY